MQIVPHHHHLTHHFWEKETLSSKLPYLHKDSMSRQRSPSGTHHNFWMDNNQEEKIRFKRETQHTDNIYRKKHFHVEEQNKYVPSRRALDKLFPCKPVLHKRAYSLSNITKPEHYPCLPTLTDQAVVKHQQKVVRKLDPLNQHFTGRKKSDVDSEHHEQKNSEKQTWLLKEMLQKKIYKTMETVQRVQKESSRSYFEKQMGDRCYNNGYADWDEEKDRYGNRREEWGREKNGDQKSREIAKWHARRRSLTPEIVKGHKPERKRESDEYEYTTNNWDQEKCNGRREREMGSGNHVRRRREIHLDREDEDLCDMRKPHSLDSMRRDRSHLKHERREDKDTHKNAERNPNQRGNRLRTVELEEELDAPHQLIPCNVCHRSFAQDRLETHMRVCEKKRPQRKVFDMSKHRAKGTELEKFLKTKSRSKTPEKHEALLQSMRQGRPHASGSKPAQLLSDLYSEYETCPHCGRRFAQGPAERHIPKCQSIKSRPPPPPKQPPNSTRRRTTH